MYSNQILKLALIFRVLSANWAGTHPFLPPRKLKLLALLLAQRQATHINILGSQRISSQRFALESMKVVHTLIKFAMIFFSGKGPSLFFAVGF